MESQQSLLKMKIVFGDAGTGKTQSITKLCETSSDDGIPVLVIPARAHDPTSGWDEILGRATGRTGWSAPEILDALEASALFAWRDKPGPGIPPRRTILAVDGPDESPHPDAWAERLIELGDLCHSRHLIAPIVMTRPESLDWMPQESDQLTYLYPPAPDLTDKLPEIFREYARTFDITVQSPEAVAWALRTPLAIRTFADVYGGKKVAAGQDFMTTLSGLFKVKLERLDEEIHKKRSSWPSGKQLALRILTELVPDFLASGNCSYERFSQCLSRSLTHLGVAIYGAAEAFEKATKAHAILEFQIIPAEGMAPDEIKVRPSFSAILDYLLAYRIADKLRSIENSGTVDNSAEGVFPSILQGRQNAQAIVVSMLLKDGFSILESGLWNSVVEQKYLEKFHTKAICDLNSRQADIHRDWVSNILIRDMESCRMVVAELILPSARVPSAIFGAEFIHEEFDKLSLDQRDLVWSGPDLLPQNCGGCWEGYGIPVHDSINLRNDDSSSSLPILAAWATSSVDSRRQKRAIAELAQWGSKCPGEFAKLLLKFSAVNDIQVVESIMIAGTGAALEFRKHGEADKLAKVAHTMFFSNREAQPLRSVVARHAARLIIERAFKIGTNLACQVKSDATPPYETVGNRLRVDAEAASEARTSFFLDIYLESHVAEKATQPFFDYYRSYGSLEFSEEAATLLSDYREELSLGEPLKPKQLRNGLIVFQVKNWGWTRETFVGEPNGDKAGEQIGPDIAIMRLHERARHGARSTVSMFQEKYIWSAVNVVSAFLCDRLPGRFDFGSPFEPILNQTGLGSEM
ncbi:MAG: hypothetical protein P1V19_25455, partial [Gimesia sp.]|nr:hypothetical protein [Gimesia sp.]